MKKYEVLHDVLKFLSLVGVGILAVVFLLRCTTEPPQPVVEVPLKCANKTWCLTYDKQAEKFYADNEELFKATTYSLLCGKKITPAKVFPAVVQAVAYAESNYDTHETYTESFIDSTTGKPAISIGIYQLSASDKIYYKNYCAGADLYNGEQNLACALGIMKTLLEKKGKTINVFGLYWSVMRPDNKRFHVTKNKFLELVPECK